MKKLFLLLAFIAFAELTNAQRYFVTGGSGLWNSTNSWSTTSGGAGGASVPTYTVDAIFDGNSPACNVNVNADCKSITCSSYTLAITINSTYLGVWGNITLGANMTFAGSGQLRSYLGATGQTTATITPNGTATPLGVTFALASGGGGTRTYTLANDFTINSLTVLSATNYTFNSNNLHIEGSVTGVGNLYGTTTFLFDGTGSGTWASTGIGTPLTINRSSGSLTITSVEFWGVPLTYTSGTVTHTGTLTLSAPCTLNSSGMTWNHVTSGNSPNAVTLTSNLNIAGNFSGGGWTNTITYNGSGGTRTIYVDGSITTGSVGGIIGSANIVLQNNSVASTWSGAGAIGNNLEIAGDLTVSGNVYYKTGTLLYTSGTVTTTSSTLNIVATATLNTTNGATTVPWNNVTFGGNSSSTMTLSSNMEVNGILTSTGSGAITWNTSTINAKGDITLNNSAAGGSGSATIEINGTGNQTMTGNATAGNGRLPNVVINKASNTLSLASTISCAEDWTYTTGTVSAGSSTVAFYNTKNLDAQGTSATMAFNDVAVNSGTRTLTGNLDVDDDLTIAGSTTLAQNSKTINLGGDWTNSGSFTETSGAFTFDGSSNQDLTNTSGETFYEVTMNKSGGTTLNLNDPITINTSLTFTAGTITTSSDYVKFIDDATTSGASSSAGYVIGNVKKLGNDVFTFPVGMGTTNYHPLTITAPSSATDQYTAKYFNTTPQTGGGGPYGNSINVSNCEYWTMSRDAGSSNVSVTLNWNSNSCHVITPISLMKVAQWDGSNWDDLGNSATTGTSTTGSVKTGAAVSSYTYGFALGECSGTWAQKTDFGGVARMYATGFATSTKGYIGTGANWDNDTNYDDFWEYDPSGNSWTQKADFGGAAKMASVGFSIGTKGYVGTGYDYTVGFSKDFWEYDPSGNSWTQKADFGGTARYFATGFATSSKGYIGMGYDGSYKTDFWEYDPSGNTWTQKSNFSGTAFANGIGYSANSKGYVGLGATASGNTDDFWEYDPSGNSWTQKTDYPGGAVNSAVSFAIGSKGYVQRGSTMVYEYDPSGNSWTQVTDFPCMGHYSGVAFAISGIGYIGTGQECSSSAASKKLWEFTPSTCSGGNMKIGNHDPTTNTDVKPQSGKIYPNPASSEAMLDYILDEHQAGTLELYSSLGQKIRAYELKPKEVFKLDLAGIQTGVYFFSVKVNGEIKYSDKLIVVK